MTYVVPFDGQDLGEAALVRAGEFADALGESVVAATVVPVDNAEYARDRGWISPDESFDLGRVVDRLGERVGSLCPAAEFRVETVDRYAPTGRIAREIRTVIRERDASLVFVGSDNAGRMVTSISSVGGSVAADTAYDVVVVRNPTAD